MSARNQSNRARACVALAISVVAIAIFVVAEGAVLLMVVEDWGFQVSTCRDVNVTDFSVCANDELGVSVFSARRKGSPGEFSQFVGFHKLTAFSETVACPVPGPASPLRCVAAIPGGLQAVVARSDGALFIVDAEKPLAEPVLFGVQAAGDVHKLACSSDGQVLISLNHECLYGWDVRGRKRLWRRDSAFTCAKFHPDARRIICGMRDGTVMEIDARSGDTIRTVVLLGRQVYQIAVSPDGKRIAALCSAESLAVCDLQTGALIWSCNHGYIGLYYGPLSFSPKGDLLATHCYVGREWPLILWDSASGREVAMLRGHTHLVRGVAFSTSGLLYSWGADGTIREWDPVRRQELRLLPVTAWCR